MTDYTSIFYFLTIILRIGLAAILFNALWQKLPRSKSEPPVVFHWFPFIGSAISYGTDPVKFYRQCRERHGDIFTFVLFGRHMTVYLGVQGNEFILNGKLQDLNAEDIYRPLTRPVFGSDIIYDCPNSKLMEQKKFVKFGLTQKALESYVPLIEREVLDYFAATPALNHGHDGIVDIPSIMAEITIYTAGRSLQGSEVRKKLSGEFAALYHDLDLGFSPINFVMPWAPLPQNRRRDVAHERMRNVYMDIIKERRKRSAGNNNNNDDDDDGEEEEEQEDEGQEPDMLRHLMGCAYKDGRPVPDKEIAHMMITMLMGGQHSSSSASAWVLLRLASRPDIAEELYRELLQQLGSDDQGTERSLRYSDLDKLPLLSQVIKETLRVHSSIHSIMRKATRDIPVPDSDYVVSAGKVLVSSPIMTQLSEEHFQDAEVWDPHRWDNEDDRQVHDENSTKAGDMVDYGYGATSKGTRSPYLPFGAGRHRCIGEKFAYLNLAVIIATMVRTFRFNTLDGKSWVPPTDYQSLFSRPTEPARVGWQRR
ncbi:cytochrome P450 51 [Truncatella angustata]|uniref:Cytochrome P450 51 n=1 Tax=Truncatella angustata TaxID=152316 RepID=A0A9P8UVP5_9PEZI|nr:cytochrome P450 51 [Truncatella angustata]KAH6658926.1 cytochrome P450 51 [Truncatella angustata]KAH8196249.1 hypothetical protein TruAng_009574 [Truncatella angustata]